jgi:hypothetical protein
MSDRMRSSPLRDSLRPRFPARVPWIFTLALGVTTGCLNRPVGTPTPTTTNLNVRVVRHSEVSKLDLLFMIDNSMSMADKQEILSDAVPVLIRRLVTPNCLDDQDRPIGVSDPNGTCAQGRPEMRSVKDIHIGVITSSLGGHGGTECSPKPDDALRTLDDRAELLPTANPAVRGTLTSWNGSGFLAWDPSQTRNTPPGEANLESLVMNFRNQVEAAGEQGCGFEGSLEAWYRFLVDPDPPIEVTSVPNAEGTAMVNRRGAVNQTIISQRKAFLRPDSLLAIVMLTDENDCSITDEDGWQSSLVTNTGGRLPRASSTCATDPDHQCCHSCGADAPPGCTPNAEDPECSKLEHLSLAEDQPNARCFDQKRRFGVDLLYPVDRYIDALTAKQVPNRAGQLTDNPLFASVNGQPAREKSLVLLAGIVGVPWQDISTPESWNGPELTYLSATELEREGRWDVILGNGNGPSDPLMRESFAERSGTHPLIDAPLAPSTSPSRTQNPINGREQAITQGDDLQYACTFQLSTPYACDDANQARCDCNADEQAHNRSLQGLPRRAHARGAPRYRRQRHRREHLPEAHRTRSWPGSRGRRKLRL